MLRFPSIIFLRTQSDARLVRLVREGSEAAFEALVERYRRDVRRACERIVPSSRVDDVVQQTLVSAWGALRRGDPVEDLRPWLLRIARNSSLNALRVRGYDYEQLSDSLTLGEAPQAVLERRETIRSTLAGLAALPERQREVLLSSAVAGASHADIARDLGLTEGAVRQLVLRARTTMRATATAVFPLPLIQWLALAGTRGEPALNRVAEIAAGGGAGAVGVGLAKFGAAAVVAGGVALTPAVVHTPRDDGQTAKASIRATASQTPTGTPASTLAVAQVDARGEDDGRVASGEQDAKARRKDARRRKAAAPKLVSGVPSRPRFEHDDDAAEDAADDRKRRPSGGSGDEDDDAPQRDGGAPERGRDDHYDGVSDSVREAAQDRVNLEDPDDFKAPGRDDEAKQDSGQSDEATATPAPQSAAQPAPSASATATATPTTSATPVAGES